MFHSSLFRRSAGQDEGSSKGIPHKHALLRIARELQRSFLSSRSIISFRAGTTLISGICGADHHLASWLVPKGSQPTDRAERQTWLATLRQYGSFTLLQFCLLQFCGICDQEIFAHQHIRCSVLHAKITCEMASKR